MTFSLTSIQSIANKVNLCLFSPFIYMIYLYEFLQKIIYVASLIMYVIVLCIMFPKFCVFFISCSHCLQILFLISGTNIICISCNESLRNVLYTAYNLRIRTLESSEVVNEKTSERNVISDSVKLQYKLSGICSFQ